MSSSRRFAFKSVTATWTGGQNGIGRKERGERAYETEAVLPQLEDTEADVGRRVEALVLVQVDHELERERAVMQDVVEVVLRLDGFSDGEALEIGRAHV